MKKKLGMAVVTLGAALAMLAPSTALARDRDDHYRGDRDGYYYRDHDRRADEHWRHEEHERLEHSRPYYNNYGPGYANGYYDGYGYWHPNPPAYNPYR